MSIVLDAPKLLPIRILSLAPKDVKNNYVYTYDATLDITAQLHSGTSGFVAKQYDGRDVAAGDYIATTSQGKILKITSITSTGPTKIVCVLMDEDQMNASVDPTQFGESSIDQDDGILFSIKEGKPFIFPLPDVLPGGLTNNFATQILSRFNYVSKEKNINVELTPHTFLIGETVLLTSSGWIAATTNPTGVVVSKDDDSFGVRLFGNKTAVSLPGDIGDTYYWDDVDRMLTKTPGSANAVKLFQKIDGKEALLLGDVRGTGGGGGGGAFSGAFNDLTNVPSTLAGYGITDAVLTPANYTDLTNKPAIPVDVSDLTDTGSLLGGTPFSGVYADLTSKPTLFSGSYTDLTSKPALFSGNYNDLYNKPTIPADLGDLTNTAGYIKSITSSNVTTALGYTPQNSATAFGGSYTDLTNKPTIPADVSDLTDTGSLLGGGGGASTLGALTDVTTSGATSGQVLKYDGTQWAPATDVSGGAANADTLDNQDGTYYLDYTNFTNKPTLFDGVYSSLTGLPILYTNSDVDAHLNQSNPTSGHVLSWNGSDYVWVANSGGGGGGASTLGSLTDVSSTTPTTGHVLKWTGSEWAPAVDATTGVGGSNYATESYVDQKLVERGNHFSGNYNDLTNLPTLFSGNFTDLNGKPTTVSGYGITDVPAALTDLAIADGNSGQVLTTDGAGNFTFTSAGAFNGDYNSLVNRPSLFSGNYLDLTNKPYIPSIAGLASTNYVDTKADYGGDKNFLNAVEFRSNIKQKVSTADTTGERRSLVMAIQTTDATVTEVLLSDATKIEIADGTTAMVELHVVGSSSIGQYSVKIQGIVHRAGGNLLLIGSQQKETLAEYSDWTADLAVNVTSLKITVKGSAATTVDWTVFATVFTVIR